MRLENTPYPNAKGPERIEAAGFTIETSPTDHADYSYVKLRREGITFKTVILNKNGLLADKVDIDTEPENLVRARYLAVEIPRAIQVALGFAEEVDEPDSPPSDDSDTFWKTPEAKRVAQAEMLARQRGDHRPDVQ